LKCLHLLFHVVVGYPVLCCDGVLVVSLPHPAVTAPIVTGSVVYNKRLSYCL